MAPQQTCQERAAHQNSDQARRALIREATKRLKITLKELQSSTVEIGVSVHFKPYTPELGVTEEWPEKSHCLKKKISKHV